MIKEKIKRYFIENNNGSTMVTVIVAVAFVIVLGAIMLSTVAFNANLKRIDRAGKDAFYYADKAINDIYTVIGQNVQEKAANAYEEAFASLGTKKSFDFDGDGTSEEYDFKKIEEANSYYKEKFLYDIKEWINSKSHTDLEGYIVDTNKDYVVSSGFSVTDIVDAVSSEKRGVRISDIEVTATNTDGSAEGVVATDILIYIPQVDFFGTNADIIEYGIIANDGIVVNGNLSVNGSVYAGIGDSDAIGMDLTNGTTSIDGEYIISKGDVRVGKESSTNKVILKVGENSTLNPNFWFNSIRTVKDSYKPEVKLKANCFALNDIELNANESKAAVSGNYYGYNDGTIACYYTDDTSAEKEHTKNSAVLINGNHSELTMLKVDNFVLMGKAYIEPNSTTEVSTAEAIALRTNQQLYLIPPDFLSKPNPLAGASSSFNSETDLTIPDKWFGRQYLKKTGGNYDISQVVVGDAVYAFFEFNNSEFVEELDGSGVGTGNIVKRADADPAKTWSKPFSARTGYIKEIMTGVNDSVNTGAPRQSELKRRIKLSLQNRDAGAFALENCVILEGPDPDNGGAIRDYKASNIYAKNSVVTYYDTDAAADKTNFTIKAIPNTAAFDRYDGYPQDFFYRYKWLCGELEPWSSKSLSDPIPKPVSTDTSNSNEKKSIASADWKISSDYPFKRFIDISNASGRVDIDDSGSSAITSTSFMIKTGSYTLSSDFDGFLICDGDLTIATGVKVSGTIITSGKITFQGQNIVKTNRAIIQKRISDEMKQVRKTGKYRSDYLITYLIDGLGNTMYDVTENEENLKIKASDFDSKYKYTDYMFFDNWQKGGR